MLLDFFDHPEIEDRIRAGLKGEFADSSQRYGLPFLGDNAFLIDRVDVCGSPVEAIWYRRVVPEVETDVIPRTTRLTIWIDRADMSRTQSALYAPMKRRPRKTTTPPGRHGRSSIPRPRRRLPRVREGRKDDP